VSTHQPAPTSAWLIAIAVASCSLVTDHHADAQVPEQAPSPTVVSPRVAASVEAPYPEGADTTLPHEVELLVTIEADGTVSDVVVPTPTGDGFDVAAQQALRAFRFEPAYRDGVPMRARIRYRYVFEPTTPTEEVMPTETPLVLPGRLRGRVLDADERPLANAEVTVDAAGTRVFAGRTDADGAFVVDALAPGTYAVHIVAEDGSTNGAEEDVVAGEETEILYRMPAVGESDEEAVLGVRAVVDPPPREVTRRTIPREMLLRVPGTRGDALRTIELMPGVARPPFGAGMLIVRGSAPTDSEVMLDGVPVPLLYHFGGLTSFIHGRLLESIDFYPGNFSSRYGRRTGGIVDVETRDPATDRVHGFAELGAIDASVLVEGPISERVSLVVAARRSMIDLLYGALLPDGAVNFTSAPVYYDYQAFLTWRPTDRDRIKFRFYGSSDGLEIEIGDEAADSPDVRGTFRGATRFNHGHVSWDRHIGEHTDQRLTLSVGPTRIRIGIGEAQDLDARLMQIFGRAEWTMTLGDRLRIVAGADVLALPFDVTYRGAPSTASEGDPGTNNTGADISLRERDFLARPGAYLDVGLALGDLYVNVGQRVDYYSEIGRATYDPRLAIRYQVIEPLRLRAGVGLYSQPPEYSESLEVLGNPSLAPIRSLHTSIGADVTVAEGVEFSLEGFYKYLWDRVLRTEDGEAPLFVSGGVGRVYGGELSAKIEPREGRPYFGYLSYTLMRSERRDDDQEDFRLFDYDQTHILTVSGGYRFPRRWEIGATFRLTSGNPYTPINGAVHDLDRPGYVPASGPYNSARSPFFHRLDLRVEKSWQLDHMLLAFFIDVQNAYNRQNQEGIAYSFDYGAQAPLRGLPILPSIGLRGEL
jgi:TonB family protein